MEINRHNYETYFLLWIDGELCNHEQKNVEEFIDKNPDLAIELALLHDAKLPIDDTIIYLNKESLLKVESSALSLSTYEDYFLLYIDNELSRTEKQEVELYVLQHPALQAEFLLLQQTILTKETIIFPNKELLYKKEQNEKPVIFFNWRRIAIAAALIGFIFSVWMIGQTSSLKQSNQQIVKISNPITSSGIETETLVSKDIATVKQINSNSISNSYKVKASKVIIQHEIAKISIPENTQPASININLINEVVNNSTSIIDETEKNKTITASVKYEPEQPSIIKQTVYRELDTDESSKSLYVGSVEINKDKLRGFLRKASIIFRSKSKQLEDKADTNK